MLWLKRRFAYADYAPYFGILEKLIDANPNLSAEFIMVSAKYNDPHLSEYYVGLPDKSFAAAFDDFEPIPESKLPKAIDTMLIGDSTKEPFTSRFRFRTAKKEALPL
jgi:hypothetical protein